MTGIETQIDPDRRRVEVTISGPVGGAKVGRTLSQLLLDDPEITSYDILYDLRAYTGDVETAHLEPVAIAYAAGRVDLTHEARSAFVTPDPHFELWAQALDFQFPGRKHAAFRTMEAAEAFLGERGR